MSRRNGELEFINIEQTVKRSGKSGKENGQVYTSRCRRKEKRILGRRVICLCMICLLAVVVLAPGRSGIKGLWKLLGSTFPVKSSGLLKGYPAGEEYPEELLELLEKNEETLDFVKSYPERTAYQNQPIDLSEDYKSGEVPLLMQWDRRWGYDSYGESMIGLAGCGPTCLDMVYLYFTGDTDMNPRKMAEFAYDNGYYTQEGTSWSLWTEGAGQLGLTGEALSLDETVMHRVLDNGGLIVCSMAPGDFTTTGHFIVLRGYDGQGFYVNDPNRRSTSEKQWDFATLQRQIKNLWVIYG